MRYTARLAGADNDISSSQLSEVLKALPAGTNINGLTDHAKAGTYPIVSQPTINRDVHGRGTPVPSKILGHLEVENIT